MTFLTLTDADNGQPIDVCVGAVQVVQTFDGTRTRLVLAGGVTVEVRETRLKVGELLRRASGKTTFHDHLGGTW